MAQKRDKTKEKKEDAKKKSPTKARSTSKKVESTATKKTTKSKKSLSSKGSPYSAEFLEEMKNKLLEMRKALLKDVTKSVKEESNYLRFEVGDFYDHASEDRQRELALTLSNREREKLIQIEAALKRIEEGTYGICEVTGEKIGEERLRAMPFATLSIEAQEELEKGGL